MITFNSNIFRSVFSLLNESCLSMSKKTGVSRDMLRRSAASGDPKVYVLVDICNAYRLDISFFFSMEQRAIEQIFVPENRWTPVEFHPERIPGYINKAEHIRCQTLAFWMNDLGLGLDDVLEHKLAQPEEDDPAKGDGGQTADDEPGAWVYVSPLFQSLPALLHVTKEQICKMSHHDIHMFIRAVVNKDVRVRTLVDVCNAFSIPISIFFQRDRHSHIPDVIVQKDCTAQRFYPIRINNLYGEAFGLTYAQLKEKLGYTNPRIIRMMSEDTPMTANELVRLCNIMGIEPSWFFESQKEHEQLIQEMTATATIRNLENKIKRAGAENARLKSQLRHMQAMEDLKK